MPEPVLETIQVRQAVTRVRGMPFRWSINPYRGCMHACIYCYANPNHRRFTARGGGLRGRAHPQRGDVSPARGHESPS